MHEPDHTAVRYGRSKTKSATTAVATATAKAEYRPRNHPISRQEDIMRGQQTRPTNRSQRRQMARNREYNPKPTKADKRLHDQQKRMARTNNRRDRTRPAYQSGVVIRR